uniref:Uncharacterized protein n=1 Tax=Rhizophora mucronata TaxID=61149 RepID=A0A2P2IU72_RHIMU
MHLLKTKTKAISHSFACWIFISQVNAFVMT